MDNTLKIQMIKNMVQCISLSENSKDILGPVSGYKVRRYHVMAKSGFNHSREIKGVFVMLRIKLINKDIQLTYNTTTTTTITNNNNNSRQYNYIISVI